jgi:hypothetical protein
MKNLMDVIEEQRSLISSYNLMNEITSSDVDVVLDRIAEAAKQPRVMKPWTGDCRPVKSGLYWIKGLECEKVFSKMLTVMEIQDGVAYCIPNMRITHWLELEPTPIISNVKA